MLHCRLYSMLYSTSSSTLERAGIDQKQNRCWHKVKTVVIMNTWPTAAAVSQWDGRGVSGAKAVE
jgi:hypothetical protein